MNGPLYLSAADVRRALPMRDAISAMWDAFAQLSLGEVDLPPRVRLDALAAHGVALFMPCHSRTQKMFSLKIVTVFDDNPQRGLPLIHATVILNDGATGAPLAVLEGASLTALRTGAASGLATDLLARPASATAAVIGTGVQARTQLEAVCCIRPIRRARVYGRNAQTAERFAAEMSQQLDLSVEPALSAAAALEDADVVCTATTATTSVFDDRDLPPGAHINAVGSFRPEVVEIPAATVRRARVVVDHLASALEEAGDLLTPYRAGLIAESHFRTELGDLVLGRSAGRTSSADITLFKSVGVAVQDLFAATLALENARRLGIGTLLEDSGET
jgi:ornithine cyclodeaminase/alanine dehydrogenase-like protein (mu-crystallin family)